MNKKNFFKSNMVFVIIIIVVLLVAYISTFTFYIGSNPFSRAYTLENPVKSYSHGSNTCYITDSGSTIMITDENDNVIRSIYGDDENNSFVKADSLAFDSEGNIYVTDMLTLENDSAYEERIIKFSPRGKKKEVVFDIETLDENELQYCNIYNIRFVNGALCFIFADNEGIYVNKLVNGEPYTVSSFKMENAYKRLFDADFDSGMNIAYAVKNGDVFTCSGEAGRKVYNARNYDNSDYFSIVSDIAYDEKDRLYFCDVGLKNVLRLNPDGSKDIIAAPENKDGSFSEAPMYTGITTSQGVISFLSSEYIYEDNEEIYIYKMLSVSEDGKVLSERESLGISPLRRLMILSVYICIVLLILIMVYAAVNLIKLLRDNKPDKNVVFQLTILVTALVVTFGVSYVIFDSVNTRYINESGANMVNTAYRIAGAIDEKDITGLDSPDSFESKHYAQIDKTVRGIIGDRNNADSGMYCVIYTLKNDTICEIYRDDGQHSTMYPMAGSYTDSIEEEISENNDFYVDYGLALSEGTYIYSLVPVYSSAGDNIAFIETGTNYGSFHDETRALYLKVLMLAAMAVIIVMLMFSEFTGAFQAVKAKRNSSREKLPCPPEVIRPLSFLFFFVANFSTAFLPIYGMRLWNEDFPISSEIAAALPLSAEFAFAAISAFVCGFIIPKLGVRIVCVLGGLCYIAGSLTAAFAGSLWFLILSNVMCGIGSGFLSIAFNSWAASYEEEEKQNKGFIHINAAYLAGLNCGTVIGSLIWESFGVKNAFLISAVIGGILIILTIFMVGKIKVTDEEEEESKGSLRDLIDPSVFRFFLCILSPYLVCTAFLEYFFPVLAEENGLSATHISMAFLISGLISIYTGASLAENITRKLGTKRTMVLASFIYASALFYLVLNPTVYSCYIVIALFAIADSFGLSAQSVYFSSLPAVKKAGQSKALGVNNTVESINSACGSLIFGAALLLGNQKGILIITAVFSALMVIFILFDKTKRVQIK